MSVSHLEVRRQEKKPCEKRWRNGLKFDTWFVINNVNFNKEKYKALYFGQKKRKNKSDV